MAMFELVQKMMFVNTSVKFRDNRLRNEVCRAATPLGHVRTNVCVGRSLYTLRGYNKKEVWANSNSWSMGKLVLRLSTKIFQSPIADSIISIKRDQEVPN